MVWLVHWLAKSESENGADYNTATGCFSGFGYSVECRCRLHTAVKIWRLRLRTRVVEFIGYGFDRSVLWSSVPRQQGFMARPQTSSSSLRFSGFTSSSPIASAVSHTQYFLSRALFIFNIFLLWGIDFSAIAYSLGNCGGYSSLDFTMKLGSISAKIKKERDRLLFSTLFVRWPKLSFLLRGILIWKFGFLYSPNHRYHDNAFVASRALHIASNLNASSTFPLLEWFFKHQVRIQVSKSICVWCMHLLKMLS